MFLRSTVLVQLLSIAYLHGSVRACPSNWPSDGYCDPVCNDAQNNWDGGDCCPSTCADADYDCGFNGYNCQDPAAQRSTRLFTKIYSGFELTLQCDADAEAGYAVRYSYSLSSDMNDLGTKRDYRNDPTVPDECQQQFRGSKMPSYKTPQCNGGNRQENPFCYDRGHIVMANHMDGTSQTRNDASFVTNLLPQASGFNQGGGSWFETEQIIECHRDFPDVERLEIFGGMVYDDESNDYFLESHGIPTPDVFYKVVVKYFKDTNMDPDVIAWIMKNESKDKAAKLDRRFNDGGDLIEVKQLKRIVNDLLTNLPVKFTERAFKAGSSWNRFSPAQCKKGNSNDEF